MFSNTKTIITISPGKLLAGQVVLDTPPRVENVVENEWTPESLTDVLRQLKVSLGIRTTRVIIAEDLTYVVQITIDRDEKNERETVQEKLQQLVPEKLDEVVWDFKDVAFTQKKKIVQAFVIDKSFFKRLSVAFKNGDIVVDAIEPISYTLARLTRNETDPHCIIYKDQKITILVANHGLVIASRVMNDPIKMEEVEKFLDFVKEHFAVSPKKIILSGEFEGFDITMLGIEGIEIEQRNLDPMIGLALKVDLKGKDEQVLNLKPLAVKKTAVSSDDEEETQQKMSSTLSTSGKDLIESNTDSQAVSNVAEVSEKKVKEVSIDEENGEKEQNQYFFPTEAEETSRFPIKKRPIIFIALSSLLLLVVGGGFSFYRFQVKAPAEEPKQEKPEQAVVIQTPTPTVTPTPEILLSKYAVQVLNGSGVSGEAGRVVGFLEGEGFEGISVGNADAFTYTDTVVRIKGGLPEAVFRTIQQVLDKEYSVIKASDLPDDEEYDLVIIVGKRVKQE